MRRAVANTLFSMLLVTTLMWGGCVSCEQFFMWPGAKRCCSSDGRCKTKQTPAGERDGAACKQLAFDHQKSFDHQVSLPVSEHRLEPVASAGFECLAGFETADSAGPSPPDLQVLHSTFLI
jgi:hypothetical protein